jgi:hypothetical protein
MAYTINLTDGSVFATIADGTVNTSSSMILVGKNYAGYGEFLDENFIQLLENFSSTSSGGNPTSSKLAAPLQGQLWWDKTSGLLKVYNGSIWKTISAATSSAVQPTSNVQGDLWYDTVNQQLKVWTGTAFIVVGPAFSSSQGTTGAIPETINDTSASPHFVTSLYVNNTRVAIVSKDATFTPVSPVSTDFPSIFNGITLWNSGSPVFGGTATNADLLDSLNSTDFMRATANTATTGTLQVNNNSGLFVGTSNAAVISATGNNGIIRGGISGGNLVIQANVGGSNFDVARALGSNGTFEISNAATVGATLAVTGNVTGGNLVTGAQVSAVGNITGGNVIGVGAVTGATVTATGNVQAGNLRTSGQVTATGNITSQGNVEGVFILGNGSQLSGLSAAVSVTKIVNGTSEGNVGEPGGNINFNVAGVSNVAVFNTNGGVFTGITTPSIAKSGTNAVGNIGSASNYFNRVFATATTALYADVAERFASDEVMEPGTVVELGGTKEITRATGELSEQVFGVISTNPAFTMNGGAGEDDTHPAVAMTGRVPVKVVGRVRKGDRLVSAGAGVARAAQPGEATAFNVIGRSLVDKLTPESGTIEAIVTIKN